MEPTYVRQTRHSPASMASTALFVDAAYVRRCAACSYNRISGSWIDASRVTIDAGQISRFVDSLVVDFKLEASRSRDGRRPGRRIYDTVRDDRRQCWRQLHYRSVVRAEGFVVRTARAPRRLSKPATIDSRDYSGVEAALAADLVYLAGGEVATVVLLAGGEGYASAVRTARELGADVVLLVPGGCSALVDEPLREAVTRVIGLHPELFESLVDVRGSGSQRRSGRASARSASVGAAR